jgi:hypothetical protein
MQQRLGHCRSLFLRAAWPAWSVSAMAGVDLAHGAAIWAGLVRVPVSSLLWYGIGGEEQRGPQADEPDHGQ